MGKKTKLGSELWSLVEVVNARMRGMDDPGAASPEEIYLLLKAIRAAERAALRLYREVEGVRCRDVGHGDGGES
jgi:hypothetical protein